MPCSGGRTTKKWYAVVLKLAASKLGLTETGDIELLNVKCDPGVACLAPHAGGLFSCLSHEQGEVAQHRLGMPELDASVADLACAEL